MKAIRCASGLGDSVYLRAICEHFVRAGDRVTALSNYPEIFEGSGCAVEPFRRERVDVVAHYVTGKANPATTQWEDVCRAAGVAGPVPFSISWAVKDPGAVSRLRERAAGRPVVLVQGGRTPMDRTDGFGKELLPDRQAFEAALDAIRGDCYLVAVGKAEPIYRLPADEDLTGRTTVSDLLDLFASCDAVVCQVGYAVPMAEVFDRPLLAVWADSGLKARHPYIAQITPAKVLSKPTSVHVVDDWDLDRIRAAARRFLRLPEAVPA